jgi:hypothetical protein
MKSAIRKEKLQNECAIFLHGIMEQILQKNGKKRKK